MNFVAQVEDHLRDLGAEARKTHPGVKEASERAILHLRSLQTQYVAAVRRAGASKSPRSSITKPNAPATSSAPQHAHPTTALFRSHEVLRPFLTALNSPESPPKLVNIAIESIQLLLRGDAILSSDGVEIAKCLSVQAKECKGSLEASGIGLMSAASSTVSALGFWGKSSAGGELRGGVGTLNQRAAKEDQSIAFKVLQTITMLVDSRSVELTSEVLGHVLLGCLVLGAGETYSNDVVGKNENKEASLPGVANVRRTALATMNQILSILFERARDVMMSTTAAGSDGGHDESSIMIEALQTLTDLCVIVHNCEEQQKRPIVGPFAVSIAKGLAPSPTTCLSLIDMIFKQRGGDFFRVCRDHFVSDAEKIESSSNGHGSKYLASPNLQFVVQSIQQTCQLVLSILQMQQSKYYDATTPVDKTLETPCDSMSFCFFYYATSLGSTILTSYLSPATLEFYEKFDSIKLPSSDDGDTASQRMCQSAGDMIGLLIGFVSGATDAYHQAEFEDGYIFSQTERQTLNIGKDDTPVTSEDESATKRKSSTHSVAAHPTPDPLISNDRLWRAFLSLEVIYCLMCSHLEQIVLLDNISQTASNETKDVPTISTITKATSDLATISGSNRERILHVVLIAHDDKSAVGEPSSAAASLAEKFSDSISDGSGEVPVCDTGLPTWLAFKCVLALVQSLKKVTMLGIESTSQHRIAQQILSEAFAPSVSVLQHYIKRMSGSHVVVSQTLCAYEELAYASMVLDSVEENLRRKTIITSLCKLCLPSWGKNRANSQLKEANIDTLWVLLWIIHLQFDNVYDEWHTILSTIDQVAILSMKSSKLPESYYKKATGISDSLVRLPEFTTCFSDEALRHFVASLVPLSEAVSFTLMVEQISDLSRQNSESFDYGDGKDDNTNQRESISGKLMNFAGRSLGFGGGAAQPPAAANIALRRSHSVDSGTPQFSKVYSDDLREAACKEMTAMKISTPRSTIRRLPLPLLLLCVVAEANSYRFSVLEEALALHLCDIVAKSTAPEYRTFAMEILIHFIPLSLSDSVRADNNQSQATSRPTKRKANKPLEIVPLDQEYRTVFSGLPTTKDVHLLRILCSTMQTSIRPETAEIGLHAIHIVLEGACHNLSGDNLISVIKTLSILSGFVASESQSDPIDRSTKAWVSVSAKSFQIFKLIFDDFLEPSVSEHDVPTHSSEEQEAIIDCCVAFGKSRHDVNTSLTATSMLWTIADQDPTPSTLDLVLSKLSFLALDNRPELRNCSVNTLVSCAVGRGHQFTNEQWERVLNKTIFGVMKDISAAINGTENQVPNADSGKKSSQRYKVAVHHSRDSATKQWSTTLVLTLRGLERVLRLFFSQLLASTSNNTSNEESPWFLYTWKEVIRISLESATLAGGRETLEIRLAGIELIALCAQLSCASGIVASANSARVGTNMEVVGGALRSVRAATVPDGQKLVANDTPLEPKVEEWRKHLFDLAFASIAVNFRDHMESSSAEPEAESDHYMIDSVSTQVLNRLTGELAKLYECCKNDEMKPVSCELQLDIFAEDDGSYESRLINLLLVMVEHTPSENTRFLNQVQRGVMTLLQTMASHSSLRALKALTSLSGDHIFVRSNDLSKGSRGEGEVFELEAAKTIAQVFNSDGMTDEVRVVVMCSVLLQYLKLYGNPDLPDINTSTKKASEARYDLFISVIDSGVEAVAHLESKHKEESPVLDAVWDRILSAVTSILMPPPINRHDAYVHHSKSFLNIVAIVLLHLPARKCAQAELMLEKGAHMAVEVAFECKADTAASEIIDGALDVFLACFMGLCQKMPASPAVRTLAYQILGEIESTAAKDDKSALELKTQQNLALAVCESLKATSSQELLVGLFPVLCRLTNVDNDGLRRAAGAILGGIKISEAISRERQRADEAEIKAKEVEEENNALLEEIDYLQAENEELQRQLAVFSESSDFT